MKITAWRFAHDCLPSGHQLQVRHIPADGACFFCGRHERIEHTILFCQFAREVWEAVSSEHHLNLGRKFFTSSRSWTLDFLERASEMEATVMITTMWHIWDARNRVREGESLMHPKSVAEKCLAYIQMIATHLFKPASNQRRETNKSVLKWSPPPVGTVSINVDAAIFASSRQMGSGVVIRDHNGVCLTACSERVDEVVTPEIAEALAMRRAMSLAKDEGFSKIIVNSDCLSVLKRIMCDTEDRSSCGTVIRDIKKLAKTFRSCSFHHVNRVINVAAHSLAKLSESLIYSVWRGVTPDCIREIICNDSVIL
jgi:ribonuclease HI